MLARGRLKQPFIFQPAAREMCRWLFLRLLHVFCIRLHLSLCIHTYHVCNNYIMYIVAMQPYLTLAI